MAEESTTNDPANHNCMLCEDTDSADDMVQCDVCDFWAHFRCAGVTENVKTEPWNCTKCSVLLHVPKTSKKVPTKKGPARKIISKSDGGSVMNGTSMEMPSLGTLLNVQDQISNEKELLEQKRLFEKCLQEQQQFMDRKRILQKEMLQQKIVQEKQLLEQQLVDEREFLQKQKNLREQFQRLRTELNHQYDAVDGTKDPVEPGRNTPNKDIQSWVDQLPSDPIVTQSKRPTSRDAEGIRSTIGIDSKQNTSTNKLSASKSCSSVSLKSLQTLIGADDENENSDSENAGELELTNEEIAIIRKIVRRSNRNGSGFDPQAIRGPTKEQLAARQACSRHLPIFKGEPEVWPLFISCYEYTTSACGFTNTDNLKRLQDSLQGLAKEAVQSRLLLPESVPEVIEDLRKLFGSPEKLLKNLVAKVRKTQPPRLDRLETFLYFGITVKQLCDHLEAASLHDHLSNPMLVQELVGKLPPEYKIDWVRFKRSRTGTPLRVFTDFINDIVSEISEVTDFTGIECKANQGLERTKQKRKEYVNTHHQPNASSIAKISSGAAILKGKRPCLVCRRMDHKIRFCDDFAKLSIQDRLKIVDKHKLCHICLNDHGKTKCTFNIRCNIENCREAHHTLLHGVQQTARAFRIECNAHLNVSRSVIFRILPVTLHFGEKFVDILAFLDEGASATLIESVVADQLNAEGTPEPLVVVWTANMKRNENKSKKVNLFISAEGSDKKYELNNVRTVKELVLPKQYVCFDELARRYKHLSSIPIVNHTGDSPKILIGLDNIHLFAPLESRIGAPGEPIAVRSLLGWTMYGPEPGKVISEAFINHHFIQSVSNQELHELLKTQYTLEEMSTSTAITQESNEERRARHIMEQTTKRIGDCFQTGLLWRYDNPTFPDSFPMAMRRMKALERRLSKNPSLNENVFAQINDYQIKNYCHRATQAELNAVDRSKIWYLPLNIVLNPKKPNKVRLVWDAAASVNGVSLNSNLLKGPDLLTSLPAVISKFRERRIAFGGDIREMYHQIRIREEDKQAQRFLFRFDSHDSPDVYVMDVATFGSTCSPSSAQFIKNRNANEHRHLYPEAADAIINRHYVDDYYDSTDSVDQATQRAHEVRLIHSKGGFEIRNWASNSEEVLQKLGEPTPERVIRFHEDKTTEQERVLGLIWNTQQDELAFSVPEQNTYLVSYRPTKRQVLSTVMSLFDPLGLLAPFTILGKILIQDLWRSGCEWDASIDEVVYGKWKQWLDMLPEIRRVRIPRPYFGNSTSEQFKSLQLHIFCDAGENAYGCAGLLRVVVDGCVKCSLVMARSKVAPLKLLTIPRLELQAAVLAARMMNTIRSNHSLDVQQVFMWTDSRTVLSWIKSDPRKYRQFVGFRIGEILNLTKVTDWHWVPSKLNIADCLTKWGRFPDMTPDGSWFRGEGFLYQPPEFWPEQEVNIPNVETEMRAAHLFHDIILTEQFINIKDISKWSVLVRVAACLYRFIANCRKKVHGQPIETLKPTENQKRLIISSICATRIPLQQKEFQKAESLLFRIAQSNSYGDEIKIFRKNEKLPYDQWISLDKSSPLYRIAPLFDSSGVLRLEGRSKNAEFLPFDMRFPIILHKDHAVTKKLVQHFHERFGHGYREAINNEIKQRFLINGLGSLVTKVEKECIRCKIRKCKPQVPRMASLPVQRLIPYHRPFTFVGVDYIGPLEVAVGRRTEKRWIVLFTCLVVRAVHLEVANSLTAQSCIMAVRRFICRRGPAAEYFSDNGTNLRAAGKEITQQIHTISTNCAEEFTNARTKWHYNPPAAPHMGGVWERMVRSVKSVMSVLDDGRRLTDEILSTTLAEAEDMINSRPLTYSYRDSPVESLTPNHFIRGTAPNEPAESLLPVNPGQALRDTYKRSQQLAEEMWKKWIREYIPTVNLRTKWFEDIKPLQKGDLVYVIDGDHRKCWIRGVVEEAIVASDGRIRQAMVRTNRGLFKRATAKLAVMEIDNCNISGNTVPVSERNLDAGTELRVGDLLKTAPLPSNAASSP
ncbi:uncharacterized protein LOC131434299 [Malaya genurostris]|uniref:uncharacterized protein LOC131434299 n=1 Tax=Malaya genurostris TaxID=325434 RepID=UPI0026F3E90C|nr:uncharacterized protein LOC131434299 [Malaya genurostris]